MNILQKILKLFFPKSIFTPSELRTMAQERRYRDVVETFRNGRVARDSSLPGILGYCYYQLANYEEAIIYLQEAVRNSPNDYFSNLFLSICYKSTAQKPKAIAQLLNCLKLSDYRPGEVLDQLLPMVLELQNPDQKNNCFVEITESISKLKDFESYLPTVLFFQGREEEITFEMSKRALFCHFYGAKNLTEMGYGKFHDLGTPEKLRFVRMEDGSEVWVDTCPPYVAEVKDAKITSGSSLVFVDKNKVLSEVLSNKDYGRYANMQYDSTVIARREEALLIRPFQPDRELSEGIMLCGLASNAYGHWFAEFLPKLRFFEKHPRFSEIPIIIDEGMPQSHYDFLGMLVRNRTILLPKGSSFLVKNLFVAPTDTFFPADMIKNHAVPPEQQSSLTRGALEYIGQKISNRYNDKVIPKTRLFLGRRSSQWRRLTNEQAIISELQKLNFEIIFIEDFSFEQQVQIFRNAEFIVAPNGSALNNLIFSNPKTKVILLGQKNLFNWGGWFGSFMELGFSPEYLAGESAGDSKEKHLDYSISIPELLKRVHEKLG